MIFPEDVQAILRKPGNQWNAADNKVIARLIKLGQRDALKVERDRLSVATLDDA